MTEINISEENTINVDLTPETPINAQVMDINYIPSYKIAEQQRQSNELNRIENENERQQYYQSIQEKVDNGEFNGEPGPQGEQGIQGPKGDPGSVKFIVVTELPTENIEENVIYMKPTDAPSEENTFNEYIYTNGGWESLGSANVDVNLTDYVKNTDYANASNAGTVKVNSNFGITIRADGIIMPAGPSKAEIDARTNTVRPLTPHIIDYSVKKSLSNCKLSGDDIWTEEEKKNARELLNLVASNDYPTDNKAGVVRCSPYRGMYMMSDGLITLKTPEDSWIDNKNSGGDVQKTTAVTLSKIDYAVKKGLTDNGLEWTEEEKAQARQTLGIVDGDEVKY